MTVTLADILSAANTIRGRADATPMVPSVHMEQAYGHPFWLKLELAQPIGAFKLRGALNAVANLPEGTRGVTCCSTGNHGRGVAFAAREKGMRAVVCMSELVPAPKVDGIRALGADVHIHGRTQDAAFAESVRLAEEEGFAMISPFDDAHVIAGQGTIGLEMLYQRPELEALLVPLSGGGLAAGIAAAAKAIKPDIRVIGISMDRGAAMYASLQAGHPVEIEEPESLADSLGGGIGMDNRFSFPMCRDLLDDVILVSEAEVYRALQTLYYEERMVAEGACVVGIAAVESGKLDLTGPTGTILTGRNLDMRVLAQVISGRDVQLGDTHIEGHKYGT
ncbi:threonine dehydratase [Roseivivax halodurans JCM 10272]|uniref:Threonine dehydratase n=1 Tax=Roseivivax halodurans JCM 10272 TaxID=1449350 RepID=X7EG06_9RHOB|nr:hydroxyectoine utilization dehydratase EutB [Roseivivax halodurans]ETX15004.1 threonine dehydratase [Roseivivax halodurans JCM 10272]